MTTRSTTTTKATTTTPTTMAMTTSFAVGASWKLLGATVEPLRGEFGSILALLELSWGAPIAVSGRE